MRVNVKLFARLRELVGTGELALDVPGGGTVADVWAALVAAHPAAEAYARSMSCAVNLDYARMTTAVSDGDEVAFLPPVSGGSEVASR
ncbi:MAG: molybdopterin converting factor subunit 1 [Acidobacteria bacterium]|nr:molybdopterin converting factor subunit 1 [Acidobacteriota bacterium]